MASRCVVADNDVIEELKTSSENLNTRKSTNLLVGIFKKLAARAALRNIGENSKKWSGRRLTSNRTVPRKIKV
jgi:hypothetical protein